MLVSWLPKLKPYISKTINLSHPFNIFPILFNFDAVKLFSLIDNNSLQFSNIEAILTKFGIFILDKSNLIKELSLNIFSVDSTKDKLKFFKSTFLILFTPSNKLFKVVRGDKKYIINSEPKTVSDVKSSFAYPFPSLIAKLILSISKFLKLKVLFALLSIK